MDRNLSRKNIRDGLWITLIIVIMAALTLVAALVYIA
jgi:hypothetical protein